jgi:hypothetical protein
MGIRTLIQLPGDMSMEQYHRFTTMWKEAMTAREQRDLVVTWGGEIKLLPINKSAAKYRRIAAWRGR